MKIGMDARASSWYRGTGIGTYTYQLLQQLCLLDKNNRYLFFLTEDSLAGLPEKANITSKVITSGSAGNGNFWEEVDIPNLLNDTGIDAYFVPQNGIGLPKEKSCPFIITLHDIIPYRMPETVGPQYLKIYTEEIPSIISRCDGIITVSQFSKQDILQAFDFPEDRIAVTPLAAEEIFYPRDTAICQQYLKRTYGLEDDFILYVGGFSPRKNIAGLIKAYAAAKPFIDQNIKLVILGRKGRSYYSYKDLAVQLELKNEVLFPGYIPVEDLPFFYNAARLFCYPSFYEGFGLPPLEAMACGTPVIASNTTSMAEVLQDDVLFAAPEDIEGIAEGIKLLLNNPQLAGEYGFKGLHRSTQFSWKRTALDTINAIQRFSS